MTDDDRQLLAFVADELAAARDAVDDRHPAALVEGLHAGLRTRMLRLVDRVLMVELHAAGMLGQLAGDTPRARFESFAARLRNEGVRTEIHAAYPQLRGVIDLVCAQWIAGVDDVLGQVADDLALVEEAFGVRGMPVRVDGADSDPHRGGRHVSVFTFEDGTRLVHKPRPMRIDVELARFVAWLGEHGLEVELRVPRTLDRGSYGFAEYVELATCETEGQVDRFHERLGAWVAVLYAIGATDVHLENLVAAGEHPVPIDLETTLHPRVFAPRVGSVDELAQEQLHEGVHGVGILPTPQWDAGAGGVVDFSALGAGAEHMTGQAVVEAGTDRMRIGVGSLEPILGRNLVTLRGVPVDSRAHVAAIERGYEHAVGVIVAASDELLAHDGPLAQLAGVPVRMLVRPTRIYAALLEQLAHPHALADPTTRAELVAQLDVPDDDWRAPFVASERAQVERWDVPLFEALAGGADVTGADGSLVVGGIVRSGISVARMRIAALAGDAADRDLQLWSLRVSLATRRHGDVVDGAGVRGDTWLEVARDAGDRLDRLAIRDAGFATWHSMQFAAGPDDDDDAYRATVVGDDLYAGLPGIVLFLSSLASETGDARFRGLAEAAWRTHERRDVRPIGIGAFSGAAGEAWIRTWLATAWERDDLLDEAEAHARSVMDHVTSDGVLDVVAGAAGAVPALLALDAARPDGIALDAAVACGHHLVAWMPDLAGLPMRRGFSHGPSGVAHALALLATRTGDDELLAQARSLVFGEANLIDETVWSDNDVPGGPVQFAWCHGAPGIALARLHLARASDDEMDWDLAWDALRATADSPMQSSGGLCHGELGNLEPLILAADHDPGAWAARLARRADSALDLARTDGLLTSMPRGLHAPGLMTGIAGIGLGALRLHAPERTPSPLTLSLPARV